MRTAAAAMMMGLTLALAPAGAAPRAERLLAKAFLNPRSVAHAGVLEVTVTAQPQAVNTVRLSCDGQGRERREHLDGPARGLVVLTDGRTTWQRPAGAELWAATPSPPAGEGTWERIRRNYQFKEIGRASCRERV